MYKLTIANEKGAEIQLSQNPSYTITSIDGLNPPQANINIAENANFDGGTLKNSRLGTRNIVITMAIEEPVELNRIALYQFFRVKHKCTVYFKNESRDVYIPGVVESFACGMFAKKEMAQISIICPNPYLIDNALQEAVFSVVQSLFEFPFSIPAAGIAFSDLIYDQEKVITVGDIETGMTITFHATGSVTNPAIYHVDKLQKTKVDISLEAGDVLEINTHRGSKSITLIRNGTSTNVINDLDPTSIWIQLDAGTNTLLYTADENPENLTATISYFNLYEGV